MKNNIDILQYIQSRKNVKLTDIAKKYDISLPTVRRYVTAWEKEELIQRTHGSVHVVNSAKFSLKHRMYKNIEQKKQIAKLAVSIINEGDTIFLGGGTTIACMCEHLTEFSQLNIITNSLYVIDFFASYRNISIICTGGVLIHDDDAFTGNFTKILYEKLYADKVFLGAEAIHPQMGLSKNVRLEELNEHFMIERGAKKIILASSEKISKVLPLIISPIEYIDILITDSLISEENLHAFNHNQVQVFIPK